MAANELVEDEKSKETTLAQDSLSEKISNYFKEG